jgi:segregation and condensation protein A
MADEIFEIKLPQFEGPFDLLLFFIERDELDIHEVSIAKITDDFLLYIYDLNKLNMELASEFIFVAATLMRIKAKMLLPRYGAEDGSNELDVKQDLIQRLIEYKKIKQVCEELKPLEEKRLKQEKRGNIQADLNILAAISAPGEELESLSLFKLMNVYSRVINRYTDKNQTITHTVVQYPYTIEQQKKQIEQLLVVNSKLDFNALAKNSDNKVHFVYNFLAVLEMLQQELVDIQMGLGYNNFFISSKIS